MNGRSITPTVVTCAKGETIDQAFARGKLMAGSAKNGVLIIPYGVEWPEIPADDVEGDCVGCAGLQHLPSCPEHVVPY